MNSREKLKKVFRDAATDPALWFSTGNLIWSLSTAEKTGIVLNAAVTTAVLATRIRNSLRDEEKAIVPLYITGAVNMATAVSALVKGTMDLGLTGLFNFTNPESRKQVFSALAYAGWGVTHLIVGYTQKHKHSPRRTGDPMIYAGVADTAILLAKPTEGINYVSLAIVGAGLLQAAFNKNIPAKIEHALSRLHITPVRLYTASYLTGSAMAASSGKISYGIALGIWGGGYALFDQSIRNSIRSALGEPKPAAK
jgi:hypothetical protein